MKSKMYVVEIISIHDEVSYSKEFDSLDDACKHYQNEINVINSDNNDDDYDYIVINQIDHEGSYVRNDETTNLPIHSFNCSASYIQ